MGYKSVAHYLIQTRRLDAKVEQNADASNPVSAKRSLPFPVEEALSNESLEVTENRVGSLKPPCEGDGGQVSVKRSLPFNDVQHDKDGCLDAMKPQSEGDGGQGSAKRSPFSDVQDTHEKFESLDAVKPTASSTEIREDSVARRLRPRLEKT